MTRLLCIPLLAGLFFWGSFSLYPQTPGPQAPGAASSQAPAESPLASGSQAPPLFLTPDEAVGLAIRNNLMLESARIGLDITRRRSDYVWNQFVPTVGVTGTVMRENWATEQQGMNMDFSSFIPGFVISTPTITLPQWRVTGGLSATLDFSFALIEGIRSVRLDYEAGILTLDKARLQMEQGVRKMYNSILLMEANAALLAESFANAQRQAQIAEANFRAGQAPRLTMLQAQVAVENLRPTVNDLNNNIRSLKGNFALILGLPFDTEFEFAALSTETIIPADLAAFISQSAAMQKPDILELQANINALHSRRKALTLQQYTPFLRLGWTLTSLYNPMLDPFSNTWFTRDNWNRGGNFSITLGMNFNGLFGFTREGQQLADMDANIQIQNIRLAQMIRETELEIFTKLNSLENILTTIEVQEAAVELAELSYRLTEEAYRAGLQDFQAVQNAALALDQARLQLLTQQFNFINDLIDLEYSLGLPFGTLISEGTL